MSLIIPTSLLVAVIETKIVSSRINVFNLSTSTSPASLVSAIVTSKPSFSKAESVATILEP